mgnify:CR=1 FL=1
MDDNPLVSIIINACNAEKYLSETIDSVLSQSYTNWEIIFWDNQSTDNTKGIVGKYTDSRIHYFMAPKFTELGEARNLAIGRSSGNFIAFLDSDDVWMPEKLEKQIPLFVDAGLGLVYSNSNFLIDKIDRGSVFDNISPIRGKCFRELLVHYPISLETVVIRKKALDQLTKMFDERFSGIEEYDLFCRVAECWEIDYIDEPLSKWRVHEDSWTHRNSEKFMEERQLMHDDLFARKDLEALYPGIIQQIKEHEYHSRMMWFWRDGQGAEARLNLSKSGKSIGRYVLFYVITFFSAKFFDRVRTKLRWLR